MRRILVVGKHGRSGTVDESTAGILDATLVMVRSRNGGAFPAFLWSVTTRLPAPPGRAGVAVPGIGIEAVRTQ
jgi:hypothetical protein